MSELEALLIVLAFCGWAYAFYMRGEYNRMYKHSLGEYNRTYKHSLHILETWDKYMTRLMDIHDRVKEQNRERITELEEVLLANVEETCEYVRINNLGDPEQKHNIKWARQVLNG